MGREAEAKAINSCVNVDPQKSVEDGNLKWTEMKDYQTRPETQRSNGIDMILIQVKIARKQIDRQW